MLFNSPISNRRKNIAIALMWLIVVLAIAGNYKFDDNYIVAYIGKDHTPYLRNAYYHFVITATIVFVGSLVFCCYTNAIIAGALMALCFGKVIDEYLCVIDYGTSEKMLQSITTIVAFIAWLIRNNILRIKHKKSAKTEHSD